MRPDPDPLDVLHETHVCRDCGAAITLPYVRSEEGYWEKAYWRVVPALSKALLAPRPSWWRRLWRAVRRGTR